MEVKWMSARAGVFRHALRVTGRALAVNSCRGLAAAGIAATAVSLSGCYIYLPKSTADVPPNAIVSASITDAGRVALGERVGPEVASIDGRVVQKSDTSVRLMVSQVRYLSGLSDQWQGQEVSLRPQDVKSLTQRTFSRSRTAMMIAGVAAGLVLSVLTLNFLGLTSGDPSRDKPTPPPPES